MSRQRRETLTLAWPGAKLVVLLKRPIAILITLLVSNDVGKQLTYDYNIRWGPALHGTSTVARHGPRPFRVRAPHALGLVVRVTHVSASGPDHALAVRQHEENPRAQTSVALRVQGGPWPGGSQPLGPVLTLPSIEAAGAQPPEHPGLQFPPTGASRGLMPFSADAATDSDSLAPGFGPRGYGVATGDAQGDRTRDSQRLSAAPRPPAGTRAYIRSPASCPNPIGPGTGGASTGGR